MEETKHKQAIETKGSQRRKYFHIRYRVLFMAFLLISPSQATSSGSEHGWFGKLTKCSAIFSMVTHKGWLSLLQDKESVTQVQVCIKEIYQLMREIDWKEVHNKLPDNVKAVLQKIPDLIANIKGLEGLALEAALVLMAGYFAWQSMELYASAKRLEQNLEYHTGQFKLLKIDIDSKMNFIEKEVNPLLKNKDVPVNLVKTIESLIEQLNDFANKLNKLNDLVYKENHYSSEKSVSAVGYMVGGVVVCMCSLCSRHLPVIVFVCGFGTYAAVNGYLSYDSLAKSLEESKHLRKNIQKMHEELAKFRASLEARKSKNDLKLGA